MRLTKNSVAALRPPVGKADHIEWDDELPGFGVRLRGGGARWVAQYRVGSQQRRESLGDVRKINLEDARKIARQRFAQAELGVDPAAERAQARAQAATTKWTLAAVADRYLGAKRAVLRPSTFNQAQYHFSVLWQPLRDRPLDAIKRADIAARLQDLTEQNGRVAAARARQNLSALFAWALREGLCECPNPAINTNDPAAGIPARERVLGDDEIRIIWKACRDDDFGRIVKLLLLTGCRREEIAGLLWSEVNLDSSVMTIPGTRTKNRKTLELILPALAIDILKSAPRRAGREYVFGFTGRGFNGFSYSTMALKRQIIEAEGSRALAPWTLHDLRRTFRTGLGKLGVAPHIAELCINHVKGGVEAIYDRYKYQPEIKSALALWADHVRSAVEGSAPKVVPLRA